MWSGDDKCQMAKGWDGWQVKTRIYNFLAGPRHAQHHQSTAATMQRRKKFEKYCLEEQRESGQFRNIVEYCRNIVGKKLRNIVWRNSASQARHCNFLVQKLLAASPSKVSSLHLLQRREVMINEGKPLS